MPDCSALLSCIIASHEYVRSAPANRSELVFSPVTTGMAIQAIALAWLAVIVTPTVAYEAMIVPFMLAGVGMGLFFAPIANVVLSAVRPDQEGKASGATNTIREVGGVFGVAVLAAIFSANGDYASPAAYVAGLQPAIAVGAVIVGLGALAALFIPARAGIVAPTDRPTEVPSGQRAAEPVLAYAEVEG